VGQEHYFIIACHFSENPENIENEQSSRYCCPETVHVILQKIQEHREIEVGQEHRKSA